MAAAATSPTTPPWRRRTIQRRLVPIVRHVIDGLSLHSLDDRDQRIPKESPKHPQSIPKASPKHPQSAHKGQNRLPTQTKMTLTANRALLHHFPTSQSIPKHPKASSKHPEHPQSAHKGQNRLLQQAKMTLTANSIITSFSDIPKHPKASQSIPKHPKSIPNPSKHPSESRASSISA